MDSKKLPWSYIINSPKGTEFILVKPGINNYFFGNDSPKIIISIKSKTNTTEENAFIQFLNHSSGRTQQLDKHFYEKGDMILLPLRSKAAKILFKK